MPDHSEYDVSLPKKKISTDTHHYLMIEPRKLDFRKPNEDSHSMNLLNFYLKGDDPVIYYGELSKDDQEQLRKLKAVNSVELTPSEKRCYDLLVKIEKEISWETLLKIKTATFLVEEDNQTWDNPYLRAESARPMDPNKEGKIKKKGDMSEDSFYEIH